MPIDPTSLIRLIREAVTVADQVKNVNLHKVLVDIQSEANELTIENMELKKRLLEAEHKLELKQVLQPGYNSYWKNGEGLLEGPYCFSCFDAQGKAVHLVKVVGGRYECKNCNSGPVLVDREEEERYHASLRNAAIARRRDNYWDN